MKEAVINKKWFYLKSIYNAALNLAMDMNEIEVQEP